MLLLHITDWLADVIANVADVVTTSVLADVIAMVVDVKTTQGDWYYGRCWSHMWLVLLPQSASILILVLRCWAEPHPKYVADGTCQCFY